ncbi:MAG TPA: hypothetical protein VFW11_07600 [Cyclobacteriaceae bacterium]|nr:hypothetical protein [Cyclobacteriaceae bacterium]
MKKIHLLGFLALTFVALSCGEECPDHATGNACLSENAINEVPWLVDLKNSITNCSCQTSVMQGTYLFHGTVFFILMNDPLCNGDGNIALFDCSGELVTVTDDIEEFAEKVTIDKVLYTCKD